MKLQIFSFGTVFEVGRILVRNATWMVLLISLMWPLKTAVAEDLIQVYRLAQEQDPTFQRESYRHEASPEALKQAYADLMPTVNADALYRRTKQEILGTDIAVYGSGIARYPAKGYTLTLTQPLVKFSSIYRAMQAKEEVKRADLKFEAAKQDLILRVAEAYVGALEAQDSLTFTRAEEAAIQRHFELAQGRYKSGLAPVTDFHDAKARLADTMALSVRAKNKLEDALEALAELTGKKIENIAKVKSAPITGTLYPQKGRGAAETLTPDTSPDGGKKAPAGVSSAVVAGGGTAAEKGRESAGVGIPLVGPDPDNLDNWMEAAPKQNFDVEAQRQAVEVAAKEIERQRAGHLPVLSLVARLNRDEEGGSLFGGESDVMTKEAYLQLTFPLFQGFSVLSKTREAIKLHSAAKADLEKEVRGVKRQAKASFLGVKSSIENAGAFRQSVLSTQIALEAKREGFKSGLFPALAVLDSERDLHRAKQDYAKAHYDYIINGLRLKKAVGTLTEEDMAGINQWLE